MANNPVPRPQIYTQWADGQANEQTIWLKYFSNAKSNQQHTDAVVVHRKLCAKNYSLHNLYEISH